MHYREYRNIHDELVLPVVGSTAGCPYSMEERACRYCAQHTYLKKMCRQKFKDTVTRFDFDRVVKEIEGAVKATSVENEKVNWIFFVDDSMLEKNFLGIWKRVKDFNIRVVFSTRPDYLTDSWISLIAKNRNIGINLGLEFFNVEDVGYMSRALNPRSYVNHNKKLIKKLLEEKIKFKAFVFLQGTRKWKNIKSNISGAIELLDNGVRVSVCPTPMADFTDLEKEADFLETEHYLGFRVPGFLSYKETPKGELRKIYSGLVKTARRNREKLFDLGIGGLELLEGIKTLKRMVREELV